MEERNLLILNELKLIPSQFRDLEPNLYTRRWFDYRRDLPSQATTRFSRAYERLYREQYAKVQDRGKASSLRVFGVSDDIFQSSSLLQFWRARQEADRLGCRYDYYLRFVFNRAFERGWKYLPRPNQLVDDDISTDCEMAWFYTKRETLQLANDEIFLAKNYCGMREQTDYYLYLVQQVQSRQAKERVLARLVYQDKILPEQFAIKHFGLVLMERASFHHNL